VGLGYSPNFFLALLASYLTLVTPPESLMKVRRQSVGTGKPISMTRTTRKIQSRFQ
jgi:hypothetical protein